VQMHGECDPVRACGFEDHQGLRWSDAGRGELPLQTGEPIRGLRERLGGREGAPITRPTGRKRPGRTINADKQLIPHHHMHFLGIPSTNKDGSHGQGGTLLVIRGRATRYGSAFTLPTGGGDVSAVRGHCRQDSHSLTTTLEPVFVLYEDVVTCPPLLSR
jgi:hypothetical protein